MLLTALHIALLIQVLAIAFDFAVGLIDLYKRSATKTPVVTTASTTMAIDYFPDATDDAGLAEEPDFYDQVIREQVVMEANYRQSMESDISSVYALMTVAELRILAREKGIKGARNARKADLMAALTSLAMH
jgi:hypothetical protein